MQDQILQPGAQFRVCCEYTPGAMHHHLYGLTPDPSCCRAQTRCRRPAHALCSGSTAAHIIVLAEARVPALPMRGFALLALPRDILAYALRVHLDTLDRYALAHVCRALRALYGGTPHDQAWLFRVWHDAMAAARDTALLEWLHERVPLPRSLSCIQYIWLCSCAALRNSVTLMLWLKQNGVDYNLICNSADCVVLAQSGCTRALEYTIGARIENYFGCFNWLALAAAQYGRLATLRWIHAHDASRIDVQVLTEALRYGHTRCALFLLQTMHPLRALARPATKARPIVRRRNVHSAPKCR